MCCGRSRGDVYDLVVIADDESALAAAFADAFIARDRRERIAVEGARVVRAVPRPQRHAGAERARSPRGAVTEPDSAPGPPSDAARQSGD